MREILTTEIKKVILHAKDVDEDTRTLIIEEDDESFTRTHYRKVIETIVFKIAPIIISIISICISCSA